MQINECKLTMMVKKTVFVLATEIWHFFQHLSFRFGTVITKNI